MKKSYVRNDRQEGMRMREGKKLGERKTETVLCFASLFFSLSFLVFFPLSSLLLSFPLLSQSVTPLLSLKNRQPPPPSHVRPSHFYVACLLSFPLEFTSQERRRRRERRQDWILGYAWSIFPFLFLPQAKSSASRLDSSERYNGSEKMLWKNPTLSLSLFTPSSHSYFKSGKKDREKMLNQSCQTVFLFSCKIFLPKRIDAWMTWEDYHEKSVHREWDTRIVDEKDCKVKILFPVVCLYLRDHVSWKRRIMHLHLTWQRLQRKIILNPFKKS